MLFFIFINLLTKNESVPDFLKSQKNLPIVTDSEYQILPELSKKIIQKHLEDVLSDEMLKGRFKNGGLIEVSLQDDSLVFVEKTDAVNVG